MLPLRIDENVFDVFLIIILPWKRNKRLLCKYFFRY